MEILPSIFGEDFLRYVLAQDDLRLRDANLSSSQTAVLRTLMSLTLQMQAQPVTARHISLVNAILPYVHDQQTTLVNTWRRQCGGDLITLPRDNDPVLTSLLELARDTYPAFIMTHEGDLATSDMAISGPVSRHPAWKTFCRAVMADDALRQLFPVKTEGEPDNDDALLELSSVLILSFGRTGTLQLALLPDTLLSSAYLRYLLPGKEQTPDAYVVSIEEVLNETRNLAARRSADVPLIYGISNVEVPPDTCIEVPWGTLRSPETTDRAFIPEAVEIGAVFHTTGPVNILSIDTSRADNPQRALTHLWKHRTDMDAWTRNADRKCDLMRLAMLLASPDQVFFAAHQASRTILDPLHRAPTLRWTATSMKIPGTSPIPITELGQEPLDRVQYWAWNADSHPQNLDIAMRRTLSSVAERTDPLDGFIDAVLAWENLFSGRPETNLRVCGAIAWLLEPQSYDRRTQLNKELGKLYASRSNLVHGSAATVDNAAGARDRAVHISLECIRRLYGNPDILNAKDSSVRGQMLLMGSKINHYEKS